MTQEMRLCNVTANGTTRVTTAQGDAAGGVWSTHGSDKKCTHGFEGLTAIITMLLFEVLGFGPLFSCLDTLVP
jgi:hypothetical protein